MRGLLDVSDKKITIESGAIARPRQARDAQAMLGSAATDREEQRSPLHPRPERIDATCLLGEASTCAGAHESMDGLGYPRGVPVTADAAELGPSPTPTTIPGRGYSGTPYSEARFWAEPSRARIRSRAWTR